MLIDANPMDALLGLRASGEPYAVYFESPACRPCRLYESRIRRLAADLDGRMDVVVVDISANKDAVREYSIREVPQVVFFVGQAEAGRVKGVADYPNLADAAKAADAQKNREIGLATPIN